MDNQNQISRSITLTAEQVKELKTYLGEQPARIANPILTFFAQLEAAQAAQENTKSVPPESQVVKEGSEPTKPLKRVK